MFSTIIILKMPKVYLKTGATPSVAIQKIAKANRIYSNILAEKERKKAEKRQLAKDARKMVSPLLRKWRKTVKKPNLFVAGTAPPSTTKPSTTD